MTEPEEKQKRDADRDERFAGHRSILDPYRDARAADVEGASDRARWLPRRDDPD
ncbi:hypothetical protein [Nocardiopsis coralliicola]